MEYTENIAKSNIFALVKMYQTHHKCSRQEAMSLVIKNEREFLGLNLSDKEVKSMTRKLNVKKGNFYKKRKRK